MKASKPIRAVAAAAIAGALTGCGPSGSAAKQIANPSDLANKARSRLRAPRSSPGEGRSRDYGYTLEVVEHSDCI